MRKFKLDYIDITKPMADHLVGEQHTIIHRKVFGTFVAAFGVGVVKFVGIWDHGFVYSIAEIIGFGLHGAGLIPWFHSLEKAEKNPVAVKIEQTDQSSSQQELVEVADPILTIKEPV